MALDLLLVRWGEHSGPVPLPEASEAAFRPPDRVAATRRLEPSTPEPAAPARWNWSAPDSPRRRSPARFAATGRCWWTHLRYCGRQDRSSVPDLARPPTVDQPRQR